MNNTERAWSKSGRVVVQKFAKMDKYQELLRKKEEAKKKLAGVTKDFKGLKHEDSASELQDLNVRLCQAHLANIEEEIRELKRELGR